MNKVILMGRLTRDPEISYSQGGSCIAKYALAVDRRYKQEEGQDADFPSCVCFGKNAEFAERYYHKGTKIAVVGRLETGSHINRDGARVYTTTVVVEEQEFAESKSASASENKPSQGYSSSAETDLEDELPFL